MTAKSPTSTRVSAAGDKAASSSTSPTANMLPSAAESRPAPTCMTALYRTTQSWKVHPSQLLFGRRHPNSREPRQTSPLPLEMRAEGLFLQRGTTMRVSPEDQMTSLTADGDRLTRSVDLLRAVGELRTQKSSQLDIQRIPSHGGPLSRQGRRPHSPILTPRMEALRVNTELKT
jgi:hypothetical protein